MSEDRNTTGIAVVGMAVRAPGAADLESFWQALVEGRDCISHFAESELDPLVPAALRQHPHFVPARGVLDDAECFDAGLFGMSANQARLLDPQQRVFLELCWHALEHAGLDPAQSEDSIGVYAGSANNTWLAALRQASPDLIERNGEFAAMLANEKDYIATRVAHLLNLTGPAVGVYTACSSSLVAIAQAWYALMNYQCDAALAGGICVIEPQAGGYISVAEGMESPDGACRPFNADASGTVFSSGGGCVVLKRVEDALAAGDTIHAVIRGVGLNNDGADKASFTAPNPAGQAAAIRLALAQADVDAASIGYVEAHGTGTALGDPIEVAALRDAFALDGKSVSCVLGSVKSNIGHLTAAAGVVGLIKAVLCLERGQIPPTAHFRTPNPRIDFDATPFRVSGEAIDWKRGDAPRRAGVSSFGVGGTNAHVVLEEGMLQHASPSRRTEHVLPLSANGEDELKSLAQRMAAALAGPDAPPLADVAWTLAHGRRQLPLRCTVVAGDAADAASRLGRPLRIGSVAPVPRQVWLFPGQGSQYPGMAAALWREEPDFRAALEPLLAVADGIDSELRGLLLDADPADDEAAARLAQTARSQPALFMVSYAMARTLEAYGLKADAMIGHSIGEYVAACLAGVFTPEQALELVARRGALMQAQPPGDMVAVYATVDELRPHLTDGIGIACYNAEALQVVSGSHQAIQAQVAELEKNGIRHSRLKVSHAFHSPLMEGALPAFTEAVAAAGPKAPHRRFYACPEGRPITSGQATDPAYWAGQIRAPVRFADSLSHVLDEDRPAVLLEVGPGRALSTLARTAGGASGHTPRAVIAFGATADAKDGDGNLVFARALGECWAQGADVDLEHRYAGESRRQVPLPGYPFRRDHYGYAAPAARSPAQEPSIASGAPATAGAGAGGDATAVIVALLAEVSGEPADSIDPALNFVSLGLDSLLLTQFSLALEKRLGLKLRFRRLLEDLDTPEKLAEHARAELPAETWGAPEPAVPAPQPEGTVIPAASDPGGIQALLASHLKLLEQQTQLLRGLAGAAPLVQPVPAAATPAAPPPPADSGATVKPERSTHSAGFGASARINLEHGAELEPEQQRWLDDFVARYTRRTHASRDFTQRHRRVMADPRAVTGFDPRWKEMVYPIVVDRSRGARLWDVDGNEYIDLLNGFGSNFLGYQPPFIAEALHAQVDAGYEIGPQHPLAAEVSELIAGFTGLPRVALCNTGSEAVMGAMRIARTVTGRDTIAVFRDSYHGIFDEAVVRGTSRFEARPAAPGITTSSSQHMLVLEYGSDEALDILRRRGGELAAIMIEPIQARHPELRPRAFVEALRDIADQAGCALIFDEVITGFRLEPGGAQAYYNVRADIGTYGKIIGGGLPFAAIAGQPRWMDALDGGDWRYGDDSQPEAGVTYFAGTFVRHPLALAAARASLKHLEQAGPGLHEALNSLTTRLTERLNRHFRACRAPVEAVSFSSMWRLRVDEDQPLASLLFYLLRHNGLHLYEQFGCFLSTAHGEAEVDQIATRIEQSVDELLELELLRRRDGQTAMSSPSAPATTIVSGSGDKKTNALPAKVPLTDAQMERWLACHYNDDAILACNESTSSEYRGPLDVDALEHAFDFVVARHDALAIRFTEDGSGQVWDPPCKVRLEHVDLRAAEDADAALLTFAAEQSARPFDLTQPPLLRAHLLKLADDHHVLLITAQHAVMDGWAWSVFSEELAGAYNAFHSGMQPDLPPADSWRAFAAAERTRRDGPEGRACLDWWSRQYEQLPDPLNLPTDHPRSKTVTFSGATVAMRFDAELTGQLRAAARAQGRTLFGFLLTGFYLLLHRIGGQQDLICGIPFAGQAGHAHARVMGDSDNTLPLRVAVKPGEPFAALLARVHTGLLDAADHQDASLGRIVQSLKRPPDTNRLMLAEVLFNLNPIASEIGYDGVEHRHRDLPKTYTNWDLAFHFNEREHGFDLLLHYNSDLFERATCTRWANVLRELLRQAAIEPQKPLGAFAVLDADTRRMVLDNWNDTAVAYDLERGLTASIGAQMLRTPERVAVESADGVLTYAELDQASSALAQALVRRGIGRGDHVGVCVRRGVQMLVAVLGVLRSGAAYVPLDPDFPAARLAYMAEQARLRHVLVTREDDVPADVAGDRELLAVAQLSAESLEKNVALPDVRGDDLAYVLFTSGSTGKPKGVRILHRNLLNFLGSMCETPGFDADDTLCAVTTLSFDIAGLELYLPLLTGGRLVIATENEQNDPRALADLIQRHRCTVLQTTPSMLRLLRDSERPQLLEKLRLFIGGEAFPLELARDVAGRGCELWNLYGPTETTIWSTCAALQPDLEAVPLGRPIANTRIYVLDAQRQPVLPGAVGEIYIGGEGVADGYLHRPDLTAERFLPDPFAGAEARMYRTGDLGAWRDGALNFHGRADNQIKIRGYRIEPGEIEVVAEAEPYVRECVAVAHRFAESDVRLVLYAVAEGPREAALTRLREHLRQQLPTYLVPQHIELLDALPKTANGKLDRRALPTPADTQTTVERVAPRSPSETLVVDAFNEVLDRSDVGVFDDFFDIGGHSLLAVRLIEKLRSSTKLDLWLRNLFEQSTPERLAAAIDALAWTAGDDSLSTGKDYGDREEVEL